MITDTASQSSRLHAGVLAWFARSARDLPWRRPDCSPWGVLVSEIMLQQTPVMRVLPAWERWMARWPEPGDLAIDPPGEAIRMWGRLGYPRRALRLHEAARLIVERHGGTVPDDHAALLALPGVGGYTAAAVSSFAYGRRHAVLDTNVRRVLARAVGGRALPPPTLTVAETRLAISLLPRDDARATRWSAAVMELGALVCTARAPRCGQCPVRRACRWQALGAPPDPGPARRGQAWAGTDRQVRGLLLATLRNLPGQACVHDLVVAVPDRVQRDPGQRARCLDSLVTDGLVEVCPDGGFRLPGTGRPG